MANKKKLKQRKKRQLKRAFKQAGKEVKVKEGLSLNFSPDYLPPYKEPAVNSEDRHKERDQGFQRALDGIYNGTVTALTHYLNNHSSMTFKCSECGLIFFGKAGHMIGAEHQRHECGKGYGTARGDRFLSVSGTWEKKRGNGKKQAKQREKLFYEMVWNDYSPQEIASTLEVNPKIIKYYFIEEGLLEEPTIETDKRLTLIETNKAGRKVYKDDTGTLYLECTSCNSIKDSDDFGNNKKGYYGKQTKCKSCESTRIKTKGVS